MFKSVVAGNLVRDPILRKVNVNGEQRSVCDFTVASTDYAGSNPVTTYVRVTAWGVQAENHARYLRKGRCVSVEGRITASSYVGQDGKPHAQLEMSSNNVEYLGSGNTGAAAAPATAAATANVPNYDAPAPEMAVVETDELPF